jgi:2-phospho-L-lactate/phosphoenolpyruvate guanylyltransferase
VRPELVIIPAKGLAAGKSRLMDVLLPSARQALNRAQLVRTVRAAAGAFGRCQTFVVSPCERVEEIVRTEGVGFIREPEPPGLNEGLETARAFLLGHGQTSLCVLPVDLPAVSEGALRELLCMRPAGRALIVPDREGDGTNFLRLPPGCAIPFSYGLNSFAKHVRLLETAGWAPEIAMGTCLRDDLDHPHHLRLYRAYGEVLAA